MASIGTWSFSLSASSISMARIMDGCTAADAVVDGVSAVEADPSTGVYVVGCGGYPNAAGELQCDAAIMDGKGCRFGAVAALQGIATPIKVAKKVMEKSPPALIVGDGATNFARQEGFAIKTNTELLGEDAIKAWQCWKESKGVPDGRVGAGTSLDTLGLIVQGVSDGRVVTGTSLDTLGLIVQDFDGNIAAGVSTSGTPYKLPGRVGDSPLPGGGLYADNTSGAACCTGDGDVLLRFCPSYHAVDLMYRGLAPQQACEEVTKDILRRVGDSAIEMGIIAMDTKGLTGASGTVKTWTDVRTGQTYHGFPYSLWEQNMEPQIRVAPPVRISGN